MKTYDIPKSGKCGNTVASRNHFGPYERPHFTPTRPRTEAQRRAGYAFGQLSAYWDKLTEDQRKLWRERASQTRSRRRMGKTSSLIGSVLYQKLNYPRLTIGLEPLTAPSCRPQFMLEPVQALTITNYGGTVALNLSVAQFPAACIMVFGSPPCKAGRAYCSTFSYLGLLPTLRDGASDIAGLYRKMYGLPPVGCRIFIRTKQQLDGWEDAPQQFTAIVPPKTSPAPKAKNRVRTNKTTVTLR